MTHLKNPFCLVNFTQERSDPPRLLSILSGKLATSVAAASAGQDPRPVTVSQEGPSGVSSTRHQPEPMTLTL